MTEEQKAGKVRAASTTKLSFSINLQLTEGEARALDAICGYGPDEFVKWFYANLGKHYLKPHENDMRSLFNTVRDELPRELGKIDKVRKAIRENLQP